MIELTNLNKSYGKNSVLNNFSININDGEFVALMGESGCGKSTLLNIIGLLENFDSGKLKINGKENIKPNSSDANKILRNDIGYLFQNFALVEDETVEYNLYLALKYIKKNKFKKSEMISFALADVGLENFQKKKIFRLSGGEQQRVALARLILKPCNIILADEPTGSLDEKNRDLILKLLRRLNEKGKTVIIVTHDNYVASQCDRTIYIG